MSTLNQLMCKGNRIALIPSFALLITGLFFAQTMYASPDQWTALEESEDLVDVSYAISDCGDASYLLLHVFNEGGLVSIVNFKLHLSDGSSQAEIDVSELAISFGDMWQASCDDNPYPQLKLALPDGLDADALEVDIAYY